MWWWFEIKLSMILISLDLLVYHCFIGLSLIYWFIIDLLVYHWLGDQVAKLNCLHRELDEIMKTTLTNLQKQVSILILSPPPPPLFFLPLLKISLGNPYLKILDLKKLLLRMPLWKKNEKFSFTPSQSTLKYGSKNRPWPKGLILY